MEAVSGISVIIPLYNKRGVISRAIDSVLAQDGVNFEIIVVDDGSTDDSEKVIAAYGEKITYIHQQNAGPSAARNCGVRASRHPVIAFLDADDEFLPGCLNVHLKCRIAHPETIISLASFRILRNESVESEAFLFDRVSQHRPTGDYFPADYFSPSFVINVHASSICVNRTLFEAIGGFDEVLRCWEITDFLLSASLRANGATLLNQILVQAHQDEKNSQFVNMRKNIAYIKRFADKTLDRMHDIPEGHRSVFLRQVDSFAYNLWDTGALTDFRNTAKKMRAYGASNRLTFLAILPLPLLKLFYWLRSLNK